MSTVLYPGSFDPFHLGHLDVVEQAVEIFGEVVVAVMHNPQKPSGDMPTDRRVEVIRAVCRHLSGVRVEAHGGLAVE
ncbi:MAG: adenylyltransferase/cytidyltransferase family protein, partial [Actinomycetota bacterium]